MTDQIAKVTNGEWLRQAAERQRIPLRTAEQVRACLEKVQKTNADMSMARLMLNHGRLTDDARGIARAWLDSRSAT